jgi:phosphoglucosamine mutase
LQLAAAVNRAGYGLSKLARFYDPYPQVLLNVEVGSKDRLEDAARLWDEVAAAEAELGQEGRVLVRPSGTEPVVRVMVEAADPAIARGTAERLAASVRTHLA